MRHQSHAEISAKTVYERLFQLVIIPTIVFTSDRRNNFICLGRNISDTRHMCHPDLAFVHHGAVVEKNRRNLAGKVAKHTVSVLPNILYPYCQTFLPQM